MENTLLKSVVEQVPSLAVLCFIVICFLKFLGSLKTFVEQLHREGIETIKANTEVLGTVVKTIEDCKHVQEDFKRFSGS